MSNAKKGNLPNMGGQTERSEEEQNLDTELVKSAACGTPKQSCDMRRF
jgi:hypothetical protein